MDFVNDKKKQLSKTDKSNIGKIDKKIKNLCNKLNKTNYYYTTSSCSGRIILIKSLDKKSENVFLFRTHDKITFKLLKSALKKVDYNELVEYKLTTSILHVACKTFKDAEALVLKAKLAGWKHSGIMSSKRNMVELLSTESISFPIMNHKKILVDDNFLKLIVKESNKKLEKTWEKIKKLENLI